MNNEKNKEEAMEIIKRIEADTKRVKELMEEKDTNYRPESNSDVEGLDYIEE
jgi:hypothetical protein